MTALHGHDQGSSSLLGPEKHTRMESILHYNSDVSFCS